MASHSTKVREKLRKRGRFWGTIGLFAISSPILSFLPFGTLLAIGVAWYGGKIIGKMAEGVDASTSVHEAFNDDNGQKRSNPVVIPKNEVVTPEEAARRAEAERRGEEIRRAAAARRAAVLQGMAGNGTAAAYEQSGTRPIIEKNNAAPVQPAAPKIKLTGDKQADEVITKGKEMLMQIRQANDAIPDSDLTEQMNDLAEVCTRIFQSVSQKPDTAPQVRKFMDYYLPTTLKMLENYHTMESAGVSKGELDEVHNTLRRGLDMVIAACQKQVDTLHAATKLDVTTDIEVLEQMLRYDGLIEDEMTLKYPTAAASHLSKGGAMLDTPDTLEMDVPDSKSTKLHL